MTTFNIIDWPCSCRNVLDLTLDAEIDTDEFGKDWVEYYILCIGYMHLDEYYTDKSKLGFCPFCNNDLTVDDSLQESITNRLREQ